MSTGESRDVPLQLIDDPALPSRAEMDEGKLEELVSSLRQVGMIEPVILAARGDRYEVVAGHRRTVAARLAGLPVVPARVYPADHPSLRVIQAHENGRREDVNPVDEAIWFAELLERDCGGDVERLAGLVGERLSYVLNRLELLELDEGTRDALRAGKIAIGVARELRKVTDPSYRRYYLEHAVKGGATVSVVCAWVTEWLNLQAATAGHPAQPVAEAVIVPVEPHNPLRCYICEKVDPRFIPEQIPVHTHCRLAILDALLANVGTKAGDAS